MSSARRTNFGDVHAYMGVPRGLEKIDLDETYGNLFTPASSQLLYTPPEPEIFDRSGLEGFVSFGVPSADGEAEAVFTGYDPYITVFEVDRFINSTHGKFRITEVGIDGTVTVAVPDTVTEAQGAVNYTVEAADNRIEVTVAGVATFTGIAPDDALLADGNIITIDSTEYTVASYVGEVLTLSPQSAVATPESYTIHSPRNTIAVTVGGVCSFAGPDPPDAALFEVGRIIIIAGVGYTISEVNAGVPTITAPPAVGVEATANYSVAELADHVDTKGFSITALAAGQVDAETDYGDEWAVTLAAGGFIHNCNVFVIFRRIRQTSAVRRFTLGYY